MNRTQWNDDLIIEKLMQIVDDFKMDTMPSRTIIENYYGNSSLTNAMSKRGGHKKYADMLGLKMEQSETKLGIEYENKCIADIVRILNMESEGTPLRFPYDVLVENAVKIDVKVSHLYNSKDGFSFYTFNLEKRQQTCDIFVCYCVENDNIVKTLVIPAYVMSGKKQLSVGIQSKYDKYIDRWDLIKEYYDFISTTV